MSREKVRRHLHSVIWDLAEGLGETTFTTHCFIAGGAVANLIRGEPVNDYDIYFTDVDTCQRVVDLLVKRWNDTPGHEQRQIAHYQVRPMDEEPDRDNLRSTGPITKEAVTPDTLKYAPVCFTPNAITLNNKIQLITRFIGSPAEITKRFDFAHTQCYYYPKTHELVTPAQALESLATHELIYTGSDYPLSSIIRTKKYIQRGWGVNAGQYLKMAIQLHALDFTKREVLAEQLIGVDLEYFHELISTIEDMKPGKALQDLNQHPFYNPFNLNQRPFYNPFSHDDSTLIGDTLLYFIGELWD